MNRLVTSTHVKLFDKNHSKYCIWYYWLLKILWPITSPIFELRISTSEANALTATLAGLCCFLVSLWDYHKTWLFFKFYFLLNQFMRTDPAAAHKFTMKWSFLPIDYRPWLTTDHGYPIGLKKTSPNLTLIFLICWKMLVGQFF